MKRILVLALVMALTFQQASWARKHKCYVKALCTYDQAELAKIAVQDSDPGERAEAVKKLADSSLLAEIAVRDTDCDVRIEAIKKLTDPTLLAKTAEEAPADSGERADLAFCWRGRVAAAYNKHLDESARVSVAGANADLIPLRVAAVTGLTDEADIERFATDDNPLVSSTAIAEMKDTRRLAQLAMECKNAFVCEAAFYRVVKDDSVLAQVAQENGSPLQPVASQFIRLNRLLDKINTTRISKLKRPQPLTFVIYRKLLDKTGMYSFQPAGEEYAQAVTLDSRNEVTPSGVYVEEVQLYILGPGGDFPFWFRQDPKEGLIIAGSAPLYISAPVDINPAINQLEQVFKVSEGANDSTR